VGGLSYVLLCSFSTDGFSEARVENLVEFNSGGAGLACDGATFCVLHEFCGRDKYPQFKRLQHASGCALGPGHGTLW
jgi:hypothetical protein